MNKHNSFLQRHWLAIIFSILVIGAGVWAFTGFTNLATAFKALNTPIAIQIPTVIPATATPAPSEATPTSQTLAIATPVLQETPPPVPGDLADLFGERLYPVLLEGEGWHLADLRGISYYRWSEADQQWVALPEIIDSLCAIKVISFRESEPLNTVCYLDFSGLGLLPDTEVASDVVLKKDPDGNIHIETQERTLYTLVVDPIDGFQWHESWEGYIMRIITATKLISQIDPQPHLADITLPEYINREYASTDTSLTARYIGAVEHEIASETGVSLGSVNLHLFARSRDALFWVSGDGQVLGINTCVPYLRIYTRSHLNRIDCFLDSTDILIPNDRYELMFFASRSVKPYLNASPITLDQPAELTYVLQELAYRESWIIKQLVTMAHLLDRGAEWIASYDGELTTSPPSLAPYYYIKTP